MSLAVCLSMFQVHTMPWSGRAEESAGHGFCRLNSCGQAYMTDALLSWPSLQSHIDHFHLISVWRQAHAS